MCTFYESFTVTNEPWVSIMKNNGDAFVLLISHSGSSSFVLFFIVDRVAKWRWRMYVQKMDER